MNETSFGSTTQLCVYQFLKSIVLQIFYCVDRWRVLRACVTRDIRGEGARSERENILPCRRNLRWDQPIHAVAPSQKDTARLWLHSNHQVPRRSPSTQWHLSRKSRVSPPQLRHSPVTPSHSTPPDRLKPTKNPPTREVNPPIPFPHHWVRNT